MNISNFSFNNSENKTRYNEVLTSFGKPLPYYSIEYINAFCFDINLACFFLYTNEKTNAQILLTGIIKEIPFEIENKKYFDFSSQYGYAGPISNAVADEKDVELFWKQLDEWFLNNDVIASFIRFNLNENFNHFTGEIHPTLLNIKGKIVSEDEQWITFEHKVRKNINKAQRENLRTEIFHKNINDKNIVDFYEVYINTMQRTKADRSFLYTLEQFKKFIYSNIECCLIVLVLLENKVVSSELVLQDEETIYSFLGGTLEDFFDKRPNDLLKFDLINWARKHNYKFYVLGGGYGKEDGIFKYKKSFFPNDVVTYYTGRKIVNTAIYQKAIEQNNSIRAAKGLAPLQNPNSNFFPLYRSS